MSVKRVNFFYGNYFYYLILLIFSPIILHLAIYYRYDSIIVLMLQTV